MWVQRKENDRCGGVVNSAFLLMLHMETPAVSEDVLGQHLSVDLTAQESFTGSFKLQYVSELRQRDRQELLIIDKNGNTALLI